MSKKKKKLKVKSVEKEAKFSKKLKKNSKPTKKVQPNKKLKAPKKSKKQTDISSKPYQVIQPTITTEEIEAILAEGMKSFLKKLEEEKKVEAENQTPINPEINRIFFDNEVANFKNSSQPKNPKKVFIYFLNLDAEVKDSFINENTLFSSNLPNQFQANNQSYYNLLHFLIDRFYKTSKFILVGSKNAIKFQQDIGKYMELPISAFKNSIEVDSKITNVELLNEIQSLLKIEANKNSQISICYNSLDNTFNQEVFTSIINNGHIYKSIEYILNLKSLDTGGMQIVDSSHLVDISNINCALSNFNSGYSIINNPHIKNIEFQELLTLLKRFSEKMVGNMLGDLLKEKSTTQSALNKIQSVLDAGNNRYEQTYSLLNEVRINLEKVIEIAGYKERATQYISLATIFQEKGLRLNFIIALNEAFGHFLGNIIKLFNLKDVNQHIATKESQSNFDYTFSQTSRVIFRQVKDDYFSTNFLDIKDPDGRKITEVIRNKIKDKIDEHTLADIIKYVETLSDLRNNISHGNLKSNKNDISINFLIDKYVTLTNKTKLMKKVSPVKNDASELLVTSYYFVFEKTYNYQTSLEKLIELRKADDSWRLPNITELVALSGHNILDEKSNYWSSSKDTQGKHFVFLKNKTIGSRDGQAPQSIIVVNSKFTAIEDTETKKLNSKELESRRKTIESLEFASELIGKNI